MLYKYFLLGTGTVRQNRLNKVPVKKKAIMEKKNIERGFTDIAYLEDVELVAWKDNRPVYVASNKYTGSATQTSKKWSRSEKKTVNVPTPDSVKQYNLSMGGVDIMDMMVSKYRTKYRRRKWYWPIFAWSINLQVVQAWRLRNKKNGVQEPLLSFIRELTVGIFAQHGHPAAKKKCLRPLQVAITEQLRYDGLEHWPSYTPLDKNNKPKRMLCKL